MLLRANLTGCSRLSTWSTCTARGQIAKGKRLCARAVTIPEDIVVEGDVCSSESSPLSNPIRVLFKHRIHEVDLVFVRVPPEV